MYFNIRCATRGSPCSIHAYTSTEMEYAATYIKKLKSKPDAGKKRKKIAKESRQLCTFEMHVRRTHMWLVASWRNKKMESESGCATYEYVWTLTCENALPHQPNQADQQKRAWRIRTISYDQHNRLRVQHYTMTKKKTNENPEAPLQKPSRIM